MPTIDMRHEWEWFDDFLGGGTFVTSAGLDPWVITDTSSAGTPTYVRVDHGETTGAFALGVAKLSLEATDEVQNVCLSWGDKLGLDIDKVRGFECRLKMSQAAADAATSFAFGMTGDRNDAIDSIAAAAIFRVVGADSTTALVVETDDTSVNNDDKATSTTLINAYKVCRIDFSDLSDVRFFVDDARVASATTFDMSNYSAGLQPFFQLQKTGGTATDAVELDYVRLWGVR